MALKPFTTTLSETTRTTVDFRVQIIPSPSRDCQDWIGTDIKTVTPQYGCNNEQVEAESEVECDIDDYELNGLDSLVLTFRAYAGQTNIDCMNVSIESSFRKFGKTIRTRLYSEFGFTASVQDYVRTNRWVMDTINNVVWSYNRR